MCYLHLSLYFFWEGDGLSFSSKDATIAVFTDTEINKFPLLALNLFYCFFIRFK